MKKLYLAVIFGLVFVLNTAEVAAQEPGCAQVTCSGHGHCVETLRGPACACHPGFAPDSTGLNCASAATLAPTPVSPQTGSVSTAPPQIAPVPTVSSQTAPAPQNLPMPAAAASVQPVPPSNPPLTVPSSPEARANRDYQRVKTELSGFSYNKDFPEYLGLLTAGKVQRSFIDYEVYLAGRRKSQANVLLSVGAVLVLTAIPLIALGSETNHEEQVAYFSSGFTSLFSGISMVATGVIRAIRSEKILKTLQPLDVSETVPTQ